MNSFADYAPSDSYKPYWTEWNGWLILNGGRFINLTGE